MLNEQLIYNGYLICFVFSEQDYPLAVELYSKAIDIFPTAVLYANRSITHLKLESVGYALTDASRAIELDKTYVKAYYRRAAAYMALGKFKQALKDFEAVSKMLFDANKLMLKHFSV